METAGPKTILIAEDELLAMFRHLVEVAQTGPWKIIAAETGGEAVRMVRTLRPDLVLMDIRMPSMDGIEATRRIRKFNKTIPIIALTAYPNYRPQALDAGVTEYIEKPVNVPDLICMIRKYLTD